MSMSQEVPAPKYTRNINKHILNTGIFNNFEPIKKLSNPSSPFKIPPTSGENVYFQRSKYSFNKMSPFLERAKISYQKNKFYGLFHKKDKNAFNLIINASSIIDNILKKSNSSAEALTNDEHLKELYNILEKHCISYLNSYCRITFTKEARQRKALVQSILKKCHKLISFCTNAQKETPEEKILDDQTLEQLKTAANNFVIDPQDFGYAAEDSEISDSCFEQKAKFMSYARDEIAKTYGDNGKLNKKILTQIKTALNDCISLFQKLNYTAEDARLAGFGPKEIFNTYTRDEIAKAFGKNGKLESDTLQQIKSAVYNMIFDFKVLGYTVEDAKKAGFEIKKISKAYTRNEIAKAFGKYRKLDKKTLMQIKTGINIFFFQQLGYTVGEARLAGFGPKEIFNTYTRDEIAKAFGKNGKLKPETLQQIKSAVNNNIYLFQQLGYTVEEAQSAGFTANDICNYNDNCNENDTHSLEPQLPSNDLKENIPYTQKEISEEKSKKPLFGKFTKTKLIKVKQIKQKDDKTSHSSKRNDDLKLSNIDDNVKSLNTINPNTNNIYAPEHSINWSEEFQSEHEESPVITGQIHQETPQTPIGVAPLSSLSHTGSNPSDIKNYSTPESELQLENNTLPSAITKIDNPLEHLNPSASGQTGKLAKEPSINTPSLDKQSEEPKENNNTLSKEKSPVITGQIHQETPQTPISVTPLSPLSHAESHPLVIKNSTLDLESQLENSTSPSAIAKIDSSLPESTTTQENSHIDELSNSANMTLPSLDAQPEESKENNSTLPEDKIKTILAGLPRSTYSYESLSNINSTPFHRKALFKDVWSEAGGITGTLRNLIQIIKYVDSDNKMKEIQNCLSSFKDYLEQKEVVTVEGLTSFGGLSNIKQCKDSTSKTSFSSDLSYKITNLQLANISGKLFLTDNQKAVLDLLESLREFGGPTYSKALYYQNKLTNGILTKKQYHWNKLFSKNKINKEYKRFKQKDRNMQSSEFLDSDKVQQDEKDALGKYTGRFYKTYNLIARGTEYGDKDELSSIKALSRLINKSHLKKEGTYYRGVKNASNLMHLLSNQDPKKFKACNWKDENDIVDRINQIQNHYLVDKGFLSTSGSKRVAGFTFGGMKRNSETDEANIFFKIKVKTGVPALPVFRKSSVSVEEEVLLDKGTRLRIDSAKVNSKRTVTINVTAEPPESDKKLEKSKENNNTLSKEEPPVNKEQIHQETPKSSTSGVPSTQESPVVSGSPNGNCPISNLKLQQPTNIKGKTPSSKSTNSTASGKIPELKKTSNTKSPLALPQKLKNGQNGVKHSAKKLNSINYDTAPPAKIKNNRHNSCYFDSLMLQLYNIKELRNFFLDSKPNEDTLAYYLKQIFTDMQKSVKSNNEITLTILENKFKGQYNNIYNGKQKDTGEVYGKILEILEDEYPDLYNKVSKITGAEVDASAEGPLASYTSNMLYDYELDHSTLKNSPNYIVVNIANPNTELENLQQEKAITLANGKSVKYSLIGCTLHQSGHYTSLVKNTFNNLWHYENDLTPGTAIPTNSFPNKNHKISQKFPTLLFYKKIEQPKSKAKQAETPPKKEKAQLPATSTHNEGLKPASSQHINNSATNSVLSKITESNSKTDNTKSQEVKLKSPETSLNNNSQNIEEQKIDLDALKSSISTSEKSSNKSQDLLSQIPQDDIKQVKEPISDIQIIKTDKQEIPNDTPKPPKSEILKSSDTKDNIEAVKLANHISDVNNGTSISSNLDNKKSTETENIEPSYKTGANVSVKSEENINKNISNINHNIAKDSHSSATTSETSEFKNYLLPQDINNYFNACINQKDENGSDFFNKSEKGYICFFKTSMMVNPCMKYSPDYYRYFECDHYTDEKGAKFLNFKFFNDDSTIQTQHVTIQFPLNDPQIGYCFFYSNKSNIQDCADGKEGLVAKFSKISNKLLFRFPKDYEPPIDYKKSSNESYSQKQPSVNGAMEMGSKVNNAHEINNALQENSTSTNMPSLNKQPAVDKPNQSNIKKQEIPSNTAPKYHEESNTSIPHDNSITNSIATPVTGSNTKTDNTESQEANLKNTGTPLNNNSQNIEEQKIDLDAQTSSISTSEESSSKSQASFPQIPQDDTKQVENPISCSQIIKTDKQEISSDTLNLPESETSKSSDTTDNIEAVKLKENTTNHISDVNNDTSISSNLDNKKSTEAEAIEPSYKTGANGSVKSEENINKNISNINHNIAKDSHSSAKTSETSGFKNHFSSKEDMLNSIKACVNPKGENNFFNKYEINYIQYIQSKIALCSTGVFSKRHYRYFECERGTNDKGNKFLKFKFFDDSGNIQKGSYVTIEFPKDRQTHSNNDIGVGSFRVDNSLTANPHTMNEVEVAFRTNNYVRSLFIVSKDYESLINAESVDKPNQSNIKKQEIPLNTAPKYHEESNTSISHDNSITNSIATPITESNSKTDNTEVVKLKENTINNNSAKESHSSGFKNHFFLKSDMENCIKACINQKDENGSSFFSNDEQRYINTFRQQIANNCAGFKSAYYYRYFKCEHSKDSNGNKSLTFKFFDDSGNIQNDDYVIITFPKNSPCSNASCYFYKDNRLIATANNTHAMQYAFSSAFSSAKSLFEVPNDYAPLINDAEMLDENELQELYSKESTWSMGYMLANTKLPGASDIHNGLIQQAGIIKNNTSNDKRQLLVNLYNTIDQKIGSAIHEKFKNITDEDGYFLNADKKSIGCSKEMKQQIVNASRIIYGHNPISITSVLGQDFLEQCNNIFNAADVNINCSEDKIVNLLLHKHLQFAGKVSKGNFIFTETGDIVYQ